jgi:hypothetical protein
MMIFYFRVGRAHVDRAHVSRADMAFLESFLHAYETREMIDAQ